MCVYIYIYDRVRARDCMRFWSKMRLNKIQYRYQIASISPLPGATPHPAAVFVGHVQHAVGRLRAFRDREILVAMGCLVSWWASWNGWEMAYKRLIISPNMIFVIGFEVLNHPFLIFLSWVLEYEVSAVEEWQTPTKSWGIYRNPVPEAGVQTRRPCHPMVVEAHPPRTNPRQSRAPHSGPKKNWKEKTWESTINIQLFKKWKNNSFSLDYSLSFWICRPKGYNIIHPTNLE